MFPGSEWCYVGDPTVLDCPKSNAKPNGPQLRSTLGTT